MRSRFFTWANLSGVWWLWVINALEKRPTSALSSLVAASKTNRKYTLTRWDDGILLFKSCTSFTWSYNFLHHRLLFSANNCPSLSLTCLISFVEFLGRMFYSHEGRFMEVCMSESLTIFQCSLIANMVLLQSGELEQDETDINTDHHEGLWPL